MEFESHRLPSGIRCILKQTKSEVVYSALMVNTGTRDELPHQHGMAHFIEHMFFKGTVHRKPYHINSLLDNVGGELNAYTAKEETVVHATTLKRDFQKAVELISDVFFHSTFPQNEIEREKGVIYDEINSYKDSPSDLIFDDFEDIIFKGSSIGRNILGTKKTLKNIKTADFIDFTSTNYFTDQMVFAVTGNITLSRFKYICEKYLGDIPQKTNTKNREIIPIYTPQNIELKKNTFQVHTIIGNRAYQFNNSKRIPLALLINLLGGPSANSRLNSILREKHGLTYGVETNFSSYSDTGIASIYFGADKENLDKCKELIEKELNNLRNNTLSSYELNRAKKQLIGQLTIAAENSEGYMLSCAKSFLLFDDIDTIERSYNKVMAISQLEMLEVVNEVFCPQNLSTLTYK